MKRELKSITQRLGKAKSFIATIKALGEAICQGLAASLGGVLKPDEAMPDLGLLLALFRRRVAGLARRVAICQEVLADWQECERFYARERDDAVARLRERLIQLRSLVKSMFGDCGPDLLDLVVNTPRLAAPLLRAVQRVIARLRDPGLALPAPATPFLELDLVPLTEELEADAICLEAALDERANAHAHVKAAQTAKDQTIAEFDVALASAAAVTRCLCVLAGKPELADRVRPATK